MDYYWLIPVIAVAGGLTYAILQAYWKHNAQSTATAADPSIAAALSENAEVNRAILGRLDAIDARLGAVEKTLTDIP